MAKETDKPDSSDPNFRKLEVEYQECVTASRFVVGTRFNYFASFTTFFVVLMGGFYYIWTTEENLLGEAKTWFLLAIAVFGFYATGTVLILEQRAIQLYRTADDRAADLERLMGIKNGIRQTFVSPKQKKKFLRIPLTHTMGIGMFYWVISFFWASLVLVGLYQVLCLILRKLSIL